VGAGRAGSRAAAVAAAAALCLLPLAGCATGSSNGSAVPPSASPPGSASATPSTTATASPTASDTETPLPAGEFVTTEVSGGTPYTGPDQAHLQRIAVGSHTGYDRLVLYFGTDAVPPFTVTPQDSATFRQDPSDLPVTLKGTSGVRVVVHDTVRANQTVEDLLPLYPAIRQVRGIGDFEAVVSYGVGVLGPARVHVTTLSSPSRLVVDVAWPDPS
jgi:hypothetical protein